MKFLGAGADAFLDDGCVVGDVTDVMDGTQ